MFDRSLCQIEMPRSAFPPCQLHGGENPPLAEYDGKVKGEDQWAFMCDPCFETYGLGLGPQLGARFIPRDDELFLTPEDIE